MQIDAQTLRDLEIFRTDDGAPALFDRLDRTVTRAGREALRRRFQRLLVDIPQIHAVQDSVTFLLPAIGDHDGILIEGLYHPFLQSPVPNDFAVSADVRVVFLTGPNMAGKTTYLKACGCAVYLAHIGMGVPARDMRMSPYEALFTSLRVTDSINLGISYFQAEARRVKGAARLLADGSRAFILFDEMFKGTNVKDAMDASTLVMDGFARTHHSTVVISSHLVELAPLFAGNRHIAFCAFEAVMHDGIPVFDYHVRDGVSSQRLGTVVLEREGVSPLLRALSRRDT